ncbi:MAG: hypothetical protein WBA99_09430 [Nodosilinea sp.]
MQLSRPEAVFPQLAQNLTVGFGEESRAPPPRFEPIAQQWQQTVERSPLN